MLPAAAPRLRHTGRGHFILRHICGDGRLPPEAGLKVRTEVLEHFAKWP
jgi:hypothetical protein